MHMPTISLERATHIVDKFRTEALAKRDAAANTYLSGQRDRYIHTLAHMPMGAADQKALEIATTEVFNTWMKELLGYSQVDCTVWNKTIKENRYEWNGTVFFNVNLEQETLPAPDNTYDFVLCTEVLEHLSLDPMFMLAELNRVTKVGGRIFLTTPNIASARGIWKMLNGETPYLFHHYLVPISPGRHNLEYSPRLLEETMDAAGFQTEHLWTIDTFDSSMPAVVELLVQHEFPTNMRGDNIFYIGRKESSVKDRYPTALYFNWK